MYFLPQVKPPNLMLNHHMNYVLSFVYMYFHYIVPKYDFVGRK